MWKISSIEFSIVPPEVVKNIARVRIIISDLYDADGYPVEGGVMDPRMGVIDPGLPCRTCGGGIGECPGHFGYLELAKPVIHVLYTKTIYQMLRLTCRKCNRVMAKSKLYERFTVPAKCPHCDTKQKKITFAKPYTYYEDKTELNPVDIRERFEKISAGDLKLIGFFGGRPEWLILTLFPIPPVTVRPSITLEGGERSEDDLTHKLVDIVRINQSLKENIDIGAPDFIISDLWELVQYHVATYFDNELSGTPLARHRSGRPLKGLVQRLRAKEGRIRGNLLGKRVNFSARTVISPDPMLSINEVGIPVQIARELTQPLHFSKQNAEEIRGFIMSDKINYVIRPDGRRIKVTEENRKDIAENIAADWVVEKQLEDGDIVLFNRQPSLHRISMMAHRVKVMPYRTFRMNPSVCFPYNADFDGDEMNLHALQTQEARTEASMLMQVKDNIISPKFGGPIIGCDLDQISGIYLLTGDDVILTKEEVSQLLSRAGILMELEDKETFTGKEIFSLLLPKNFNIVYKANYGDAEVVIENGQLKAGRIDKNGVGPEKGKIIKKLVRLGDSDTVKDFIDNCGRLAAAYITMRGFSFGLSDLDLPAEVKKEVRRELDAVENEVIGFVDAYKRKELKPLPGRTLFESMEAQIMNTLANGVSRISEVVFATIKDNDIVNMIMSGAKGSIINTTQMSAVVGQETILGKRISRGYYHRTLPHITPNDMSSMFKGFVARGFKDGLNPIELYWNIMNGREGLMDKSLRTRKSGYMQRRLINALQDIKVHNDLSVRNAYGEIVQFKAGEDGVDPTKSDWGVINWRDMVEKIKNR